MKVSALHPRFLCGWKTPPGPPLPAAAALCLSRQGEGTERAALAISRNSALPLLSDASTMSIRLAAILLLTAALPAWSAERVCEQSESSVSAAPAGRRVASVQHQVCETSGGGVAAAVTVFVGEPGAPLDGTRVAAIAVPRSRDEWPRMVWRSESALEVWVPNLAQVLEAAASAGEVSVALRYCGDDPGARARVAQYQSDLQQWMAAVTRWNELRQSDAAAAGERPARPREPRETSRPCRDSDLRQ